MLITTFPYPRYLSIHTYSVFHASDQKKKKKKEKKKKKKGRKEKEKKRKRIERKRNDRSKAMMNPG